MWSRLASSIPPCRLSSLSDAFTVVRLGKADMWKWNVRPLQAGRRDRISNIEELCVFGHFHLYFDRQTWTSTHKTQPHTNCGKHLTHSTLFFKGAPHTHTHTHTSRHMQKCGHTSYKHAICTEWHVCVQNYIRGETVQ